MAGRGSRHDGRQWTPTATAATGRLVAIILMHLITLLAMPPLTAEITAKLTGHSNAFARDDQVQVDALGRWAADREAYATTARGRSAEDR